ncbi:MAG: CPBP family intramembrane glutamic endopeptidase [Chloroflexota bacterium]
MIWLLVALFMIPLAIHLVALPVTALRNNNQLPWEIWMTPAEDGLYHTPEGRGWGALTKGQLINRLVLNAVVGLIAVSIFAFFEEIGWRAWMQPRLVELYGMRSGILMGAVIWALWHTPFALSGIHHINGVPVWAMAFCSLIGLTGAGIVLGWLWLNTESIWIVSIGHGALNNWGQYAFKFMREPEDEPMGIHENVALYATVNVTLLLLGLIILVLGGI